MIMVVPPLLVCDTISLLLFCLYVTLSTYETNSFPYFVACSSQIRLAVYQLILYFVGKGKSLEEYGWYWGDMKRYVCDINWV